jgi:hypothetical protein
MTSKRERTLEVLRAKRNLYGHLAEVCQYKMIRTPNTLPRYTALKQIVSMLFGKVAKVNKLIHELETK